MTLFEGILRDAIRIDPTPLIRPGFEQVTFGGDSSLPRLEPIPVATISIKLVATEALNRLVDLIRSEEEEAPDDRAWYEFYITFNDYTPSGVDGWIQVVVRGTTASDAGFSHRIELTRLEQNMVRAYIDDQCRQHVAIGASITDLLRAVRTRMLN